MTLVHHELCFGCGRTNLFGLLLDADRAGADAVAGRCFIKQDHQGPQRGSAHQGILATALVEAMAFACGEEFALTKVEVEVDAPVPVGSYLAVEARVDGRDGEEAHASASARTDSDYVGSARGTFRLCRST